MMHGFSLKIQAFPNFEMFIQENGLICVVEVPLVMFLLVFSQERLRIENTPSITP